jgi:tetratricopeptide (TPR) repeat protein
MKQILWIAGVLGMLSALGACGTQETTGANRTNAPLTKEEAAMQLTPDDLFSGDKIRLYLKKDTLQGTVSNKLFLTALDAYKNKKNLAQAERGFIASIIKFPTAKAYYELGNVYLDLKQYDDALLAYRMAENLNYEPFSKLMYNIACVYSNKKQGEQSAQYLEYAIQAGYMNLDNIEKDPDLSYLRDESTYYYRMHLKRALNGATNPEQIYYLQFKKHFPVIKVPLSIKETVSKTHFDMENSISYDYEKFIPEMRDEKFSREVSKGFYYYAKLAETANYTAVIYIIRDEFMGEEAPLTYKLVTFDATGNIIDQLIVAGRERFDEELRMCSINPKLEISVDLFETKFEKDPESEGYYENPVVSKSKVGTQLYKVQVSGKITAWSNPV